MVEADLETFEDVRPFLRALEVEARPPHDDVAAVLDEKLQRLLEAQDHRPAVDDREHDHSKRRLQRRVLVQVVEHGEDLRLALELNDDPHPIAVRFVTKIRDAFELSLRDELGDLGHEGRLVDRVRKLIHDDPLAAVGGLFERVSRPDDDPAVPG